MAKRSALTRVAFTQRIRNHDVSPLPKGGYREERAARWARRMIILAMSSRSIRHFPTRFVVFFRHPKKAGAAYGTAGIKMKLMIIVSNNRKVKGAGETCGRPRLS